MSSPEQIAQWLDQYLRGKLSAQDQENLQAWRKGSPENEALFQRIIDQEQLRRDLVEFDATAHEDVWKKFMEKDPALKEIPFFKNYDARARALEKEGSMATAGEEEKRYNKKPWWRQPIAAAALLLLVVGLTGYGWWKYNAPGKTTEIVTYPVKNDVPPGTNKATLVLADGSTLALGNTNQPIPVQGSANVALRDSGALVYQSTGAAQSANSFNTLTTPRGGQFQLELPDGTRVWLNAATSLHYPAGFSGKERKVELTGEAYFEVAKDATRPFKVTINGSSEVTVLGTRFNINAYKDEPLVTTTLLEGKVKFQQAVLQPGQEAQLGVDGRLSVTAVDPEASVGWKKGTTTFRDADIPRIMRAVSRWYDVDIEYTGKMPTRHLSGGLPRQSSLAEVIRILALYDIHVNLSGKKLVISP